MAILLLVTVAALLMLLLFATLNTPESQPLRIRADRPRHLRRRR